MKWSKYNYLINSPTQGFLLYNSRSGVFIKVSEVLFNELRKIEANNSKIDDIRPDELSYFIKNKIIVNEYEDNNVITEQKYVRYLKSFKNSSLGIVLAPTLACNFSCPYCYEANLPNNQMTEKIQHDVIAFINSFKDYCSGIDLCWHGGEPLIAYHTIKSILKKIKEESEVPLVSHSMVTNGYLFTEEMCDFFAENKLEYVQITIDGSPETHNKTRIHKSGIPTYHTILSNIDLILDKMPDCMVGIRANIYKDNREDFPKMYKEFEDRWKGKNYSIYPAFVQDHGLCKLPCLSPKDKSQFFQDLFYKHDFKNINFHPKQVVGSCTAIYENTFVIDPQGLLYKCWVDIGVEEKVIGNVIDGVTNDGLVAEYILGTDKFSDSKCLECKIFPICNGGCNLYRWDFIHKGLPYNVCPIDEDGIEKYLEIVYLTHNKQL